MAHPVPMDVDSVSNDKDRMNLCASLLSRPVGSEFVSWRAGPGGQLPYMSVGDVVQMANEILGVDGWSQSFPDDPVQVSPCNPLSSPDKVASSTFIIRLKVRVQLSAALGGAYREAFGIGTSSMKPEALAYSHALKSAESDGFKRCMSRLGESLGNCVNHPKFIQFLRSTRNNKNSEGHGYFARDQVHLPLDRDVIPSPVAVAPRPLYRSSSSEVSVPSHPTLMKNPVQVSSRDKGFRTSVATIAHEVDEFDDGNDFEGSFSDFEV